jgi:hypothetical protein
MYFDRFDICEAYYLFLSEWHTGQDSWEYARLSRLLTWFTPRHGLRDFYDLTDNGQEIYLGLEERYQID